MQNVDDYIRATAAGERDVMEHLTALAAASPPAPRTAERLLNCYLRKPSASLRHFLASFSSAFLFLLVNHLLQRVVRLHLHLLVMKLVDEECDFQACV